MTMENLISLQSSGSRSIGEPTAPRPAGVHQGSVLVVLDVNKGVNPAALYWALANVVRKDDTVKILGIVTHIPNAMGFMMRVDQSIRNSPNIMELQFEIATKKEAIWRTNHINEWCRRAGVKLGVDVKAGNNPKVIATDEAKSMGAYHVVLDKNMKKERKYFIDNLTCFVSRFRSSGGVDTIRSYAVNQSNKLPPMTPKHPTPSQPGHRSKASNASCSSGGHRGGASSMSSTSFELEGESSDEFSAHEGDGPLSAPSTGDSMDRPLGPDLELKIFRTASEQVAAAPAVKLAAPAGNLYHLLRGGPVALKSGDNFYNMNVNPLRKACVDRNSLSDVDQGPPTPRNGQRIIHHQQSGSFNGWIGQINVAPEMGRSKMGRQTLAATLQTQASFNGGRKQQIIRPDKLSMDMHWPLVHWADCRRASKNFRTSAHQYPNNNASYTVQLANSHNFRTAGRNRSRVPHVSSSGLNYGDMIDSD